MLRVSRNGGTPDSGTRRRLGRLVGLFSRFSTGSLLATGCSQVTFLLLYGPGQTGALIASMGAFLAGAIPNFLVQRYWTWRRAGTPHLLREVLPYAAIVITTALLAAGATTTVEWLLGDAIAEHALQTVVLWGVFFGTYAVLFVVKFVLLDRVVFAAPAPTNSRHHVPNSTRE